MASRPVFLSSPDPSKLIDEVPISFAWAGGFAVSQKKKNILAMHEAASLIGLSPILEVSTKSEEKLGQRLSAFNLKIGTPVGDISIECAFQGSKVFEHGGPFTDLYNTDSRSAKRDERLRNSGRLIGFDFFGDHWPLEPKTCFYDWLYLNALKPHKSFLTRLFKYSGFSDIEFNPEKSINCQARTCALLVSLLRRDMLDNALRSKTDFISIIQGKPKAALSTEEPFQPCLLESAVPAENAESSNDVPNATPQKEESADVDNTSFGVSGFISKEATALIPEIKNANNHIFKLAYEVNRLLQSLLLSYAKSDLHTSSLSKENIYTVTLIRSTSLFQGLLILIERGMINESQILIRSLIENAFFVAALEQSHDDVVRYLQDSDKFSKYKMAQILIARGDISPNHPDFEKITKISKNKIKPPESIRSIAKLGALEKKYLWYSQLSSSSTHFSASSISKYMDTGTDRKVWTGFKTGPGEDDEIFQVISEGISAALDISVVGTSIFSDPTNNNKIRNLMQAHNKGTLASGPEKDA